MFNVVQNSNREEPKRRFPILLSSDCPYLRTRLLCLSL